MATYVGVTEWVQAAKGTDTGGNQWLGASARIVKDADASTDTSFVLYAEYYFYLWSTVSDTSPYNIYKFVTGVDTGSMFSDTTSPNRRESIRIDSGAGTRKGTVRRVSLGTFGNNVNVSTNAFKTGVSLSSGPVISNAAVASWTTPAAPSGATDYVNKVVLGTDVLIDISNDTVTPEKMLAGTTAHDQDGAPISGSIATKTGNDITRSGATITVPAGYYASPGATYTVPSGSAVTPTGQTITGTTSLAYNSTSGKVEASFTGSKTITPNVTAGYVTIGTGNTVNASGSVSKTPTELDSNLIASNIRSKVNGTAVSIMGITGTFTSDATAAAGDILSGRTAYKDGAKITGTMANHNSANVTITNVSGTALSGYYGGTSKAVIDSTSASNLTPENIAEGITILGVTGTLSADDMISIQDTKTVNSSFTQQTYTADSGYNYMANVVVRPIVVTRAITGTTDGYTVTIAEYSES